MKILKKYYWILIIGIMLFIHCFRIGNIPYGINVDEMGMGYDAWCLANWGVDRYQNSYPLYLINFSGGQSALYAYLCAPFVYAFGLSAAVLRIPAIIFSFVTLYFAVRISDCLWNNRKSNIVVGFLYTVLPVFLMLSRIGLDCNLMLGTATAFLYFAIKAIETQKGIDFLIVGITGGFVLYSYVISHMVMPIFVLLMLIYLLYLRKINFKQLCAMCIPLGIMAAPLILMHIINMFDLNEMTIGIFTIPKLYRYRSDDLTLSGIGRNLLRFFKITLFYDNVKFDSITRFGNVYFVSIPFILIGFVYDIILVLRSIKLKEWNAHAIVLFWMISVCISGTLIGLEGGINVYHVNSVFVIYLLFLTNGLWLTYKLLRKYCDKMAQIGMILCGCIYLCLFGSFIKYYFVDYTKDTYLIDLFNFKFDDVLDYIERDLPSDVENRTTYIGGGNQTYIYYLTSTMVSPYDYNELTDDKPYTLWQWTQVYKNYVFDFPEVVDPAGNYIVPETSTEYVDLYRQYGFKEEHIDTHYLFWNAMLDREQSDTEALVSWGHGVKEGHIVFDEGENTVLSGWAVNTTYGKAWDDVIACVDGQYYVAEKMERQDVVDVLQSDIFLNCGFHIDIPSEKIRHNSVKVYFIDYQNQVCYIEELQD